MEHVNSADSSVKSGTKVSVMRTSPLDFYESLPNSLSKKLLLGRQMPIRT